MALVRACAQLFPISLLVATALSASAQEEEPIGPPPLPTRVYGADGSTDAFGTAADAPSGQAEVPEDSASAQSGDQGPPSLPTREYTEEGGFGVSAEAPSGQVETAEAVPASPEDPVPPEGPADVVPPDEMEAGPTASPDPSSEGSQDLTPEGADPSAALSELVEGLPEEPADAAGVSPEELDALTEGLAEQLTEGGGEAASPEMLNEALEALPDEIAGEGGDPVPDTAFEDASETMTGETASGDASGEAGDSVGGIEGVLDAPAEEALPEEALPEQTLPAETPAIVAEEQTQTAAADVTAEPTEGGAAAAGSGVIVYAAFDNTLLETRLFRLRASQGETPEEVSTALDALGAAPDEWIASAPDGSWLLLGTQRFDDACAGWPCLAVVPADLSSGEAVRTSADVVHPDGTGAIASGGGLIVYAATGGPHDMDLWALTRQGDAWSEPLLLTAQSPYAYNDVPALSADGARVAFDCGDQPFGLEGTAICEAATDGSAFRVVLTPQDAPAGIEPVGAHHSPSYAPDGSIVFQSRWTEGVWRVTDAGAPTPVGTFTGESAPCVLPDGRIASLWIGRSGNVGLSELKVMTPDGASYVMLLTDLHLDDIDCGG